MSKRYLVRYEDGVLDTRVPPILDGARPDRVVVDFVEQTAANGLAGLDLSEAHLNFQACDYPGRN